MKKIADISHHDHPINWDITRQELEFVIFRSSIGKDGKDERYLRYTSECGIPYGAYHYVMAGTAEDAREEARWFVEYANYARQKPLFYIADIEYKAQDAKTTEPVCIAFLEELRKLGCEKIGMYINRKYKYCGDSPKLCDIMWIPHWGKNDGNIPEDKYKPKYYNDLWQYTSEGYLKGIDETVDLDLINGDKPLEYFIEGWTPPTYKLGDAVLRNGFRGPDVKELQERLNKTLGTKLDADGAFGQKTEEALKQFQKKNNLPETGVYDKQTHNVMTGEGGKSQYTTKHSVNVRTGDGTDFEKITNLPKNTPLNVVMDGEQKPVVSANGWYAVYIMDKIGWLSGTYVKEGAST
jgi:GH25 family lysozyme M1 (1,4-beta-N-acetylmuramidase)